MQKDNLREEQLTKVCGGSGDTVPTKTPDSKSIPSGKNPPILSSPSTLAPNWNPNTF